MRDRRFKWWWLLAIPSAVALFGWVFGEIVMHLWNWLMPALFGLKLITFWQGLGLLILARILVGGFGGGGGPRHRRDRRHLMERWERLTPEEREKMREWMRTRCGEMGSAPGQRQEPA
jgi:hypothetical protein